ncbi:uncharacterized protein LOC111715183 [Eurytemora carolleeae]|uniref:uncharacterized protein LOC111715183 n=1 Tax=Eurytemora carolleeae TaxID=1294199 RepID=UPI000C780876|nr:uncharacterized protein LOC111715183 [Eurytemora carolleeae]|eukprot:XP_023346229.1 uncharacterized protein LOC111715183 [Eurytemora affinis]
MDRFEYWVNHLKLVQHPGDEEGFFREEFRDTFIVKNNLGECRNSATVAYFAQKTSPPFSPSSFLFRCKGAELLYYHFGAPLTIKIFMNGVRQDPVNFTLGPQIDEGQTLFTAVPKDTWFTRIVESEDENNFTVYSCSLIPGFELADFEARKYGDLMQEN